MSNAQACLHELSGIKLFAAKAASKRLTLMLDGLDFPIYGSIPRLLSAPGEVPIHNDVLESDEIFRGFEESVECGDDGLWENLFSLTCD